MQSQKDTPYSYSKAAFLQKKKVLKTFRLQYLLCFHVIFQLLRIVNDSGFSNYIHFYLSWIFQLRFNLF